MCRGWYIRPMFRYSLHSGEVEKRLEERGKEERRWNVQVAAVWNHYIFDAGQTDRLTYMGRYEYRPTDCDEVL